jgi:hypothetical protein
VRGARERIDGVGVVKYAATQHLVAHLDNMQVIWETLFTSVGLLVVTVTVVVILGVGLLLWWNRKID